MNEILLRDPRTFDAPASGITIIAPFAQPSPIPSYQVRESSHNYRSYGGRTAHLARYVVFLPCGKKSGQVPPPIKIRPKEIVCILFDFSPSATPIPA